MVSLPSAKYNSSLKTNRRYQNVEILHRWQKRHEHYVDDKLFSGYFNKEVSPWVHNQMSALDHESPYAFKGGVSNRGSQIDFDWHAIIIQGDCYHGLVI